MLAKASIHASVATENTVLTDSALVLNLDYRLRGNDSGYTLMTARKNRRPWGRRFGIGLAVILTERIGRPATSRERLSRDTATKASTLFVTIPEDFHDYTL